MSPGRCKPPDGGEPMRIPIDWRMTRLPQAALTQPRVPQAGRVASRNRPDREILTSEALGEVMGACIATMLQGEHTEWNKP